MSQPNTPREAIPGVSDQQYLFALINALANRMQTMGDGLFEELTWKQWFALLGVTSFPEPPGIMEAAERIGTSHQNMKQLLIRLEKAGFVKLARDPLDKRRTVIWLTEAIHGLEAKYGRDTTAFMKGMYEDISEGDIGVTIATLLRMEENLRRISQARKGEGA